MEIGDLVIWRGRVYTLLGFDPMGVVDGNAHLEEPGSGKRIIVPAAELEEPPSPPPG